MVSASSYFVLHFSSTPLLFGEIRPLVRTNDDLAGNFGGRDVSGTGGGGDFTAYLETTESVADWTSGTGDLTETNLGG